jgi:hypothetical protein
MERRDVDQRPFILDSGYFKETARAPHNFTALDQWKGTDKEVVGVLICFGSGTWIDPRASWYVQQCEARHLLWGGWFFMYAHLSVAAQVNAWLKTPRSPYFPATVDYERSKKYASIPNASQLLEAFRRFEDAEKRPAIGYSRKELMDAHLATMTAQDLNARWWWLAQYGNDRRKEDTRQAILPNRLKREKVILHQVADKGAPPIGFTPAAQSQDWNRWVGVQSLEEFTGTASPLPAPWNAVSPETPAIVAGPPCVHCAQPTAHIPGGVHS